MNGSKVFSKLDLKWGFHQLELSDESRPITTFATHMGMYRYKRLMFDVTSAPEIYQFTIQNVLSDCEGARNMTDDIIIHADFVEEHDRRLEKVLSTLQANWLTLNSKQVCVQSDGERVHGVPFVWKRNGPDIREDRGREEHTKTKIIIRGQKPFGPSQFQCTVH